jgi:hypothetical protein
MIVEIMSTPPVAVVNTPPVAVVAAIAHRTDASISLRFATVCDENGDKTLDAADC